MTVRYRSERDDEAVRKRLVELAHERRRFGYRRLHVFLREEGFAVNHKRVFRLYREEKLCVRKRKGRKRALGPRSPLAAALAPNARWSLDFVHDQMTDGRRFRMLGVVDDCTRECLGLVADTSISGKRVARELDRIISWRGKPGTIVSDNGTEFTSNAILAWAQTNDVGWHYIQPGKPDHNAFIERFNRTYRTEVLNAYVFESLDQVQEITAEWLQSYNEERPHDAVAGLPPATYRANLEARSSPLLVSP